MIKDIKINFVGVVVDSNELSKYVSASVAGNKMQLGIINGIYSYNKNIWTTSSYPYKMFTFKDKGKIFIRGGKSRIGKGSKTVFIPHVNLILFKQLSFFLGYFISLFIWCLKNRGNKALIVYNTLSYIAFPSLLVGKFFRCKTFCVVADLPISKVKKSLLQRLEDKVEIDLISKFDGLIPLTKHIPHDFAQNTPFVVVEAGFEYNDKDIDLNIKENDHKNLKTIVFTGTLNVLSGIELLLESFTKIKEQNVSLHIYGSGDKELIIKKYAEKNDRICFHGKVEYAEILKIQQKADLLVSPRLTDDFTTKYTFPSKILEYIASGKPVLSNRLPGIPSDYEELINFTDNSTSKEWAEKIVNIICDDTGYYKEKANNAKQLIKENKTWEYQSKKIFDFISGFYNKNIK